MGPNSMNCEQAESLNNWIYDIDRSILYNTICVENRLGSAQ